MAYNKENNITPQTIKKQIDTGLDDKLNQKPKYYVEPEEINVAADPIVSYMSKPQLEKAITELQKNMENAAKDLDFLQAAKYRDEWMALKNKLSNL